MANGSGSLMSKTFGGLGKLALHTSVLVVPEAELHVSSEGLLVRIIR